MNGNNKNLILVGLLVVIVGLGGIWTFIKYRSTSNSPVADLGLVSYVNAQGQEWSIPKGEYEFKVSSADRYPKFITGFIDPLDVKVGDIQKMLVAINNDQPLKRVWAEIETDNGVRILDLVPESSAPMSSKDYKDEPYLVDENGVLVLNDGNNEDLLVKFVDTVSAQNKVTQYRYEGEWKVEDTHTRTYQTRFVVEDVTGRLDSITLAWSDPVCSFDSNDGTLLNSCSPTGGVEGFDSASAINTTIGTGLTVNLTNAVLAFNPGTSVLLSSTGKIILSSGGKIQKYYQCVNDSDNDTYPSSVARSTSTASDCGSMYRVYERSTTADCYDNNANAKPGQTTAYGGNRGSTGYGALVTDSTAQGLSFDYDCNGVEQRATTTTPTTFLPHRVAAGYEAFCDPYNGNKVVDLYDANGSLYDPDMAAAGWYWETKTPGSGVMPDCGSNTRYLFYSGGHNETCDAAGGVLGYKNYYSGVAGYYPIYCR
jgi:hypothetical protein